MLLVGAFFGTTFPNLFFQTYRELAPAPYYNSTGTPSPWSPSRSPAGTPSATGALPPTFVNPNPYGGQKPPAGRVYMPKIYGFRVSERARSGPRMRWLRLRPETAAELDMVDWRGRWIGSEEEYEDDEEGGEAPMEDFDPVRSSFSQPQLFLTLMAYRTMRGRTMTKSQRRKKMTQRLRLRKRMRLWERRSEVLGDPHVIRPALIAIALVAR